jgi:beta-lactamase regulating signal transducer with metallopeptidase domain
MRKVVLGATFLGAALAVRAAVAGSEATHPILGILGILAILLGLTLAGLVIVLPALLVSTALRKFFNHRDLECDEPEERRFVLPGAMESRPSAIAAKR